MSRRNALSWPCHSESFFHCVYGAHLVGDWTNPADTGRDVRDLTVATAAQEGFEKTWRLENIEPDTPNPAIPDRDMNTAFALNTSQVINLDGSCFHRLRFLGETAQSTR